MNEKYFYVHSAKKMCREVSKLPAGAIFYRLNTCAIPTGKILEDVRRDYVLYHCHLVGGSDPKKYGKYGKHEVYIVNK